MAPHRIQQRFPRDEFAGTRKQLQQHIERTRLEQDIHARTAEAPVARINGVRVALISSRIHFRTCAMRVRVLLHAAIPHSSLTQPRSSGRAPLARVSAAEPLEIKPLGRISMSSFYRRLLTALALLAAAA